MKSATGCERCSRPSAASISVARDTSGFVMEWMRKIVSVVIAVPAARLR